MPTTDSPDLATYSTGTILAGVRRTSAFSLSYLLIIQALVTALILVSWASGARPDGQATTGISCVFLLLFGLPHGAFDISSLLALHITVMQRVVGVILYITIGTVMATIWWYAPLLALFLFLIAGTVHFEEDWRDVGSPFLTYGAALGVLTAPTILHGSTVSTIFGTITSLKNSAGLEHMLAIVSPIAIAAALAANAILWFDGDRKIAIGSLISLFGLIALPPIVGFSLFFCLHHSPLHFNKALTSDIRSRLLFWAVPTILMTFLALTLAAFIYRFDTFASPSAGAIKASFIVLSILTVPHMLMPRIIRARDLAS